MTSAPEIELSDAAAIEIRTQLVGMPKAQRIAAIFRSIAKGSDRIVAALLGAGVDRFLSEGIVSDVELETIRQEWAKARHPDEVSRLSILQSDHAYLMQAGEILRSYPSKCSGPSIVAPVLAELSKLEAGYAAESAWRKSESMRNVPKLIARRKAMGSHR